MRLAWITLLALGCASSPESPVEEPAHNDVDSEVSAMPTAALNPDDPSSCAPCHAAVVGEWQESMHSRAHHDNDPIYGAMRELRMARQGEQVAGKCAQCHTPRDPANDASEVAHTGVSCATCHAAESVGEGLGAQALHFADGATFYGPSELAAGASPVHGTGGTRPHLADGRTLCLTCHDAMKNPSDAPTCTTGPESADSEASCTSCHMPLVEAASGSVDRDAQHRSHQFAGPHRAWYQDDPSMLAQAVDLSARLDGGKVHITLANQTGHAFPTGFPGRTAVVRATGFDAEGNEVWHNIESDPMAERPDAVLNKVYVDDAGSPTLPPFAARLARDNRLTAGETRELAWDVPAAVDRVDVKLVFLLLPGPAVAALGLEGTPEATPRGFAQTSTRQE